MALRNCLRITSRFNDLSSILNSSQPPACRLYHASTINQSPKQEDLKSPVGAWTEWDPLEEIVVGIAENAVVPELDPEVKVRTPRSEREFFIKNGGKFWADSIPKEHWELLLKQVNEFVRILELEGVKVVRPEPIDNAKTYKLLDIESHGFYNAMPRDFLLVVGDELIEATMTWRSRYFEYTAYRNLILDYWKRGAKWTVAPKPTKYDKLIDKDAVSKLDDPNMKSYAITTESEPCFDAADFIRAGRDIFAQRSQVTNLSGIEWVRRHLKPRGINVHRLSFTDPQPMHIDANFTLVKPGLALQNPDRPCDQSHYIRQAGWDIYDAPYPVIDPSHKFWFGSKWLSMNVLMLDSERVMIEASEKPLRDLYEKLGVKTIPVDFQFAYSIGGGLHCWTSDIRRKGTLQSYFDWSKVQIPE